MDGQQSSIVSPPFRTILVQKVEHFFDCVDRMVKFTCMGLTGIMTFIIIIQVFGRVFLPRPFSWTEELARYLMIWGAFIGASSLIRTWENVYVDFFIEKLPVQLKNWVYNGILIIIFCLVGLVWKIALSVLPKLGLYQISPALGISMFWAHLGMLIGLGLVILQLFGMILTHFLTGR
jgi:TRAP-type C4-dicarboxylate transport system permease small subunit